MSRGVRPEQISWANEQQASLFSHNDFQSLEPLYPNISISRDFFNLAKNVACFRDEQRWSLLYSVAWRLIFSDRLLLKNRVDPEVTRLFTMQSAIFRDRHKMEAFVRFKKVERSENIEMAHYVAWFEPDHLIVPSTAPFFVKRFHNMSWSILTPDLCAHWDQDKLSFSDGEKNRPQIEDDLELLWCEYYANIFNPARVKIKAMQSEMPKKYWANLPEAVLISELVRKAGERTDAMIDASETEKWKKTKNSKYVTKKQDDLRRQRATDSMRKEEKEKRKTAKRGRKAP